MGLNKYKLGEFICKVDRRNTALEYGIESVRGISNTKEITKTKADVEESVLHKFVIVLPGEFVYNPRTTRMGNKVGLGYNKTGIPFLTTFNNIVFTLTPHAEGYLLADYLYIYFNRPEFDRYAMIHSWGSATELFTFEEMCDIDIELPSLEIQKKYANIYNSLVTNQHSYEHGLEDLKFSLDAFIDRIKHTSSSKKIGQILLEIDNRNTNIKISEVKGININKQFMPSIANTTGVDLSKYKVVSNNQFAYSGMQTGRDECIRIALMKNVHPIIISPAYTVFTIKDKSVLPEYIMIWFSRKQSDRRGWFMSDSSIRSNLDLDRFYETAIPIPDLKVQEIAVKLYNAYILRRNINEKLKAQIKDICPILIRGSLLEGR